MTAEVRYDGTRKTGTLGHSSRRGPGGGSGATLLLTPSKAVDGLSRQDVSQIRTRVHGEVWRRYSTLPKSSLANLCRRLWRAWEARIDPPAQWANVSGQPTWNNGQFGFFRENTWVVSVSDGEVFLLQKVKGRWHIN